MKLYLNCKGPKIGTGKIDIENIQEIITLEKALKYYKSYLVENNNSSSLEFESKIKELDKFINVLQISSSEKMLKKFESSVAIGLTDFLKKKRLQQNWSIKDISKKLNLKPSYYNNIEKELLSPPAETLIDIFYVLDVLPKIKVKLYEYVPAVEYYYNTIKITEINFRLIDEYLEHTRILKLKLENDCIEEFKTISNILSL